MAETNLNAFTNSCAGYVHTYILGPIVQHLTGKGYQVTLEELAGVLQLPANRAPVMPAPAVPTMAFGGAVPPMAAAVAPTNSRKNTATATPVVGRTCMYQFKRGENKGKYCGKATSPGVEFCNACLKARKGLTAGGAGTVPGIAPGTGAIPGMAGVPPGYANPTVPAAAPAQGGQLSVVPYDEAKGLFREPNHGFIVYQVSPGVIAVLGRLIEAENRIVNLTDQEKITAQNIGLVINDTQQPAAAAVPAIPAVPVAAVPAVPAAVPQIPTAVIHPGPIHTGQPTLPTITPLAIPAGTPTGVPQIPGIPQINM